MSPARAGNISVAKFLSQDSVAIVHILLEYVYIYERTQISQIIDTYIYFFNMTTKRKRERERKRHVSYSIQTVGESNVFRFSQVRSAFCSARMACGNSWTRTGHEPGDV